MNMLYYTRARKKKTEHKGKVGCALVSVQMFAFIGFWVRTRAFAFSLPLVCCRGPRTSTSAGQKHACTGHSLHDTAGMHAHHGGRIIFSLPVPKDPCPTSHDQVLVPGPPRYVPLARRQLLHGSSHVPRGDEPEPSSSRVVADDATCQKPTTSNQGSRRDGPTLFPPENVTKRKTKDIWQAHGP